MTNAKRFGLIGLVGFMAVFWAWGARAGTLTFVSDLITNSQPASGSDHSITFTAETAVPNNGFIRYLFDAGFSGFGSLDANDYDFAVNGTERAVSADGACTGGDYADVTTSGTRIDVELCGSGASVSAGHQVRLRVGTNASTGGTGDERLTNPDTTGSKNVNLFTLTSGLSVLDSATAIVSINNPITLSVGSGSPSPAPTPTPGGGPGTTECSRIADFTEECLVNIVDLSIMMYNWPVIRNDPETDLNSDGVVGIIDLSILLYWWTG